MAQAGTNIIVAFKVEATLGVAPGATGAEKLRLTPSPGLKLTKEPIRSNEIRPDQLSTIPRHGSRAVLTVSAVLKPVSPLVFMLITKSAAPYVLPVFFLFDSCLNSGWLLATNGYMMRASPRENRGMFTAAMMSLPGICAGVSAIIAGFLLRSWEGLSIELAGRTWTNFHLLFLVCAILRALCIPLAIRVREERSNHPIEVLTAIVGILPLRMRTLPVKIYRHITTRNKPEGPDNQ